MPAIIRGKITDAWKINPNAWIFKLKQFFASFGAYDDKWKIYGGNAFVLLLNNETEALQTCFVIKAIFKQVSLIDVALDVEIIDPLPQQQGYINTLLDTETKNISKPHFTINAATLSNIEALNLMLNILLPTMNGWSFAEAETIELCILFPEKSQQELADWLRIKQSAISQRKARAQFELLLKVDEFFRFKVISPNTYLHK